MRNVVESLSSWAYVMFSHDKTVMDLGGEYHEVQCPSHVRILYMA